MRNFLFASIDFLDVVFALTSKLEHTLSRKLRATLGMSTLAQEGIVFPSVQKNLFFLHLRLSKTELEQFLLDLT